MGGTPNPKFQEMCEDASLLVHECTNAAIPEKIGRGDKGKKTQEGGLTPSLVEKRNQQGQAVGGGNSGPSSESSTGTRSQARSTGLTEKDEMKRVEVRKKAEGRGHATPKEVGEFARAIRARRVVVNHFSAMCVFGASCRRRVSVLCLRSAHVVAKVPVTEISNQRTLPIDPFVHLPVSLSHTIPRSAFV